MWAWIIDLLNFSKGEKNRKGLVLSLGFMVRCTNDDEY